MQSAYKASRKGYGTEAVVKAFLTHGVSNNKPQTDAGIASQEFLKIVEGYPKEGELLLVPSLMAGRPITLD